MSKIIRNFTPHTVHVYGIGPGGPNDAQGFPSEGIARAEEIVTPFAPLRFDHFGDCGMIQEVPVCTKRYGNVTGLPEPTRDNMYIVSLVVRQALPDRTDLLVPHDMVRDAEGRVIGCRGFSQ